MNNKDSNHGKRLQECNIDKFIEKIQEELALGYSFTPLLGSSIGYQSGIMPTEEIGNYLCYVYYKMFLADSNHHWDIISDGWPEVPTEAQKNICITKLKEVYISYCKDLGIPVNDEKENEINIGDGIFNIEKEGIDINHEHYFGSYINRPLCPYIIPKAVGLEKADFGLRQMLKSLHKGSNLGFYSIDTTDIYTEKKLLVRTGFYSLYSWETALDFFSKIRKKDIDGYYMVEQPDLNIINNFNQFITSKKKPNQNHHLIVHLARPLRFRKILTTNADSLLEQAFAKNQQVINIHYPFKDDKLPSDDVLNIPVSLLKINGKTYSGRAHFDVAEKTHIKNRKIFSRYFGTGHSYYSNNPSHLLVIGDYLSDKNMISKILYSLQINSYLCVFIISSSVREIHIENIFADYISKDRIYFIRAKEPSLTLYELYQRLCYSLPPGGFFYQYAQYKPPKYNLRKTEFKTDLQKKTNEIMELISHNNSSQGFVFYIEGKSSVSEFGSEVFYGMQRVNNNGYRYLWLETEDNFNASDFLTSFLRAIFYELGKIHQEHILIELLKDDSQEMLERKIKNYVKFLKIDTKKWVLFAYCRNPMGECAGIDDKSISSADFKLEESIKILKSVGFSVIYISSLEKNYQIKKYKIKNDVFDKKIKIEIKKETGSLKIEDIVKEILKLIKDKSKKNIYPYRFEILKFIYVSTLFRQSRNLSALFSEAYIDRITTNNSLEDDNTGKIGNAIVNLRNEFEKIGLFVRKPGGYVWAHRKIRLAIREKLESGEIHKELGVEYTAKYDLKTLKESRAFSHFWIGEWYFKGFLATANPVPLEEALYHWFSAINNSLEEIKKENVNLQKHFVVLSYSLGEICKAMRLASGFIKYWMYDTKVSAFSKGKILQALGLTEPIDELPTQLDNCPWNKFTSLQHGYLSTLVTDMIIQSQNIEIELNHQHGDSIIRMSPRDVYKDIEYEQSNNLQQLIRVSFITKKTDDKKVKDILLLLENSFVNCLLNEFTSITEQECKKHSVFNDIKNITESVSNQPETIKFLICVKRLKEKFKQKKEDTCSELYNQPKILLTMSRYYCDSASLMIKWIKIAELRNTNYNYYSPGNIRILWKSVSLICRHSLDLLHMLSPKYYPNEMQLRPNILCMKGLALAHVNQFYEAHRHINEALSWNFNFGERKRSGITASANIRRAEIHLLEARYIKKHPSKSKSSGKINQLDCLRLYIAKLDDAYIALEKAESIMSGSNHSSLWWGRLYIIKMSLYAEYDYTNTKENAIAPCFYTLKKEHKEYINELLDQGLLVSSNNHIQKIILIDLYLQAGENISIKYSLRNKEFDKYFTYKKLKKYHPELEFDNVSVDLSKIIFGQNSSEKFCGDSKKYFDKVQERVDSHYQINHRDSRSLDGQPLSDLITE